VLLPALAWGEKDGTVTNSERMISRQRAFLPPPPEARPDWRMVADVAAAMGWRKHFAWRGSADVFREWAAMTAFENDGARTLDLGGLASLEDGAYQNLAPVRWPVRAGHAPSGRLFTDGRFATPDGRARLGEVRPAPPANATSGAFPFALITARVRDQWHTMTRTGLAPDLCRHAPEPLLDMHPEDAARLGLEDGAMAEVTTPYGAAILAARLTDGAARGVVCAPMHWTDAFAPAGRTGPLVNPDRDPVSGQPEFKHTPAAVRAWAETWRGFVIARGDAFRGGHIDWPQGIVWRRIPHAHAQVFEIAGRGSEEERDAVTRAALAEAPETELALSDPGRSLVRLARLDGDMLAAVVCLGPVDVRLPPRDWLASRFGSPLSPSDRAVLLLGRAPGCADQGALVCACMGVGARRIDAAIQAGAQDVESVGAATSAGTNCGSCRTDIARMIAAARRIEQAA
jgi:assimilatory nitrate reductase catalytic subunit